MDKKQSQCSSKTILISHNRNVLITRWAKLCSRHYEKCKSHKKKRRRLVIIYMYNVNVLPGDQKFIWSSQDNGRTYVFYPSKSVTVILVFSRTTAENIIQINFTLDSIMKYKQKIYVLRLFSWGRQCSQNLSQSKSQP